MKLDFYEEKPEYLKWKHGKSSHSAIYGSGVLGRKFANSDKINTNQCSS